MAIVLKVCTFIYWLGLIPLGLGIFPINLIKKERRRLSLIYLCGLALMICIFQIMGTVFVFRLKPFSELETVFTISSTILSFSGLIYALIDIGRKGLNSYFEFPSIKKLDKKDLITYILFGGLLITQMVLAYIMATPNDDDAVYVTVANIADKLDKMFIISPEMGCSEPLDVRHGLSSFPLMYAFLARKCNLHVAVIAHKILPVFIIFIAYAVFYHVGKLLFNDDSSKISVFMVLIASLNIFGASSIYSREVFFLTRTWQGKSILANIAIPAVFYILLLIAKQEVDRKHMVTTERVGAFILLTIVNMVGNYASGLGMFMLPLYEGIVLIVMAIRNKSTWYITLGLISVIPSFVYLYLYKFW